MNNYYHSPKVFVSLLLLLVPSVYILFSPGILFSQGDRGSFDLPAHREQMTGRGLFITNRCVRCHTLGRGRFVGPDLYGVGERYSGDELIKWITDPQAVYREAGKMPINEGYPPMPALGVSPERAELIADYLIGFEPPPQSAEAKAQGGGTIEGRIVNRTYDESASGVEVELSAFMGDRATDVFTTKTDKEGLFAFKSLRWDRSYSVGLNFKETRYESPKMVFYPEEDTKTLALAVYEPIESGESVVVATNHMILEISEDSVMVLEIAVFENRSSFIFVGRESDDGGGRETLEFAVPKGSYEFNLIEGLEPERVRKTPRGFSSSAPLFPGSNRVVFTYRLPLDGGRRIEKTFRYPTESFILLVSDAADRVRVEGLGAGESVSLENQRYVRWTGRDLDSSNTVPIRIEVPFEFERNVVWFAVGIVVVAVLSGAFYSLVTAPRSQKAGVEESPSPTDIEREREALIEQIAELDASYEAGEIEKESYESMRREKKERALELTRRSKKGS